ncbi:MAG: RHS repeat protein, partial [Alphaproteobacteria bacterium]
MACLAARAPDRGVTDIVFDARGLITQQTDARGIVSTFTYDAAGRVLTRSFPSAPAENVAYVYDATAGGNKGVGRLTSLTDASGAHAYAYDARGNVILETRTIAGLGYVTGFAYDLADNLVTLTYPSGRIVNYTRDGLGRVVGVSTRLNASAPPVTVASGITYAPFGPLTGLGFGNGIVLSQTFDPDYRLTGIAATGVQNLGYTYDTAGNVTAISDAQTTSGKPAGNQSFAYDDLNRLI